MGLPQYAKSVILELCRKYGPALHTPEDINGAALMAAVAQNESSLGYNCAPRFEPAYYFGGLYCKGDQLELCEKYGRAAACSYGPWQVMAINARPISIGQLISDPEAGAQAFVQFFNNYVIAGKRAGTISEIAQVYNSGHIAPNPAPGVLRYVHDLQAAYIDAQGAEGNASSIA